jgi:hypothetical protein
MDVVAEQSREKKRAVYTTTIMASQNILSLDLPTAIFDLATVVEPPVTRGG